MVRGELSFVLRFPGSEVGWLDSSGFEFNTTRPPSQCALEYNTCGLTIVFSVGHF